MSRANNAEMKLYSTRDIEASVRKAYEGFTHVALNRGYALLKPVYFKTGVLVDLPLMQYASWIPASESQLKRWKSIGGVLIEQDLHPGKEYKPDVTVMIECPYDKERLIACNFRNKDYGVIPNPVSWTTHEESVDLRLPPKEVLHPLWTVAAGKPFTLSELSRETGIPTNILQYVKNALHPEENWYIQKRLAPERQELLPAWDWLEAGTFPKGVIYLSGHMRYIEELAKFGYINLKKYFHFKEEEPDWEVVARRRNNALNELAEIRLLVESLPDHLST